MCRNRIRVGSKGQSYVTKEGNKASRYYDLEVACGKCPACKRRKARELAFRVSVQSQKYANNFFVTLTYENSKLPLTKNRYANLSIEHYTNFLKLLRYHDKNTNLKYFACGEYGSKTFRPHYHLILLNLNSTQSIEKAWPFGHVYIGSVTPQSISYCTKYMCKDSKIPVHSKDDRIPEFHRNSNGMGTHYLSEQMIRYHLNNPYDLYCYDLGIKYPMPRYIREAIFPDHVRSLQTMHILEELRTQDDDLKSHVHRLYGNRIHWMEYKHLGNEQSELIHSKSYYNARKTF